MPIQFVSTNPALDQFNARVSAADQARRQEDQDFRQRFQLERQVGLDRGIRDVFGRAPEQPAAAPAAATPPASPAIAGYTAQPDFEQVSPTPVPTAAQPATAAPAQPAARPSAGGTSYRDVMSGLSKVPGAGPAMLNLYSTERRGEQQARLEERKIHMEGIKLFTDASKNGDVATMRAVSQRYDLGIPPEALNRREIMANIAAGVNTAKNMGITDDEKAVAFGMAHIEAVASGADPVKALQAGWAAAQKIPAKTNLKNPHYYTAADNSVQAVGPDLVARPVQGPRARPPQPPFAITPAGAEARDQGLRNTAIDNARQEAGRRWGRMSADEKQQRIDAHFDFLKSGKPGMPAPTRGAGAVPGAPPPIRFRFDAQGNPVK